MAGDEKVGKWERLGKIFTREVNGNCGVAHLFVRDHRKARMPRVQPRRNLSVRNEPHAPNPGRKSLQASQGIAQLFVIWGA